MSLLFLGTLLRLYRGDAAFSEDGMVRQLGYKAQQVVQIAPFYPSSKTCNACRGIHQDHHDLTLADRVWTCPVCNTVWGRDLNAARNIRNEGMRLVGA